MKIWTCKIGETDQENVPNGADLPMRESVGRTYRRITGEEPEFIFSGWGAELTEPERAVVENREPSEEHYREWKHADMLAQALRLTQEYIGDEALPAVEGWSWFDALNAHADLTGDESWRPVAPKEDGS